MKTQQEILQMRGEKEVTIRDAVIDEIKNLDFTKRWIHEVILAQNQFKKHKAGWFSKGSKTRIEITDKELLSIIEEYKANGYVVYLCGEDCFTPVSIKISIRKNDCVYREA